jgi:phenylacetate-CoA ligase
MASSNAPRRREIETYDRPALERYQLQRLIELFDAILPDNQFYREKFSGLSTPWKTIRDLAVLPFTFKEELLSVRQAGHLSANQTYPTDAYVRLHETSGTRGRPILVLDTASDWQWWIDCWQYILDAADVEPADRVFLAFSFGPFIGFWSAHDACVRRGCLVIPGGGLSTLARLELMRATKATVVFCTPSYALHMAEVAADHQLDIGALDVRTLILAGEPGGSIAATRNRIEQAWKASVLDHAGATEVGPWGFGDQQGRGLFVNESQFVPEFLSVANGAPAAEGELAELVLTSLGRLGSPMIRYRTGDLVRPVWKHNYSCRFVFLEGGILGRADDMLIVRGVNIYPSAVEQIVRGFPEVVEFRVTASRRGEMDHLHIEVEDRLSAPQRIAEEVRTRIGLKVDVTCVALGSLPRFEGKGRRFVDQRKARTS